MQCALVADIGVPMIFVQWPLMICVLIPVIAIEAFVIRKRLQMPYARAVAGATKTNLVSTFVGVPFAWAIMLAVEFATLYPIVLASEKWHWHLEKSPLMSIFYVLGMAWTGPAAHSAWPIALAAALLLVPAFFVSVCIERRIYRSSYAAVDSAAVDRSCWFANLYSYALLFLAACGWIAWELHKRR
jgi:hypothetical protein